MATKTTKAPATEPTSTETPTAATPAFPTFEMPKFDLTKFDMAKFDMAKLEVPAILRETAEKVSEQMKEHYAKMKTAAEEATDLMEDTYSTATRGISEINLKALDNARTNINAAFDFARAFAGVKTAAEAVELHTSYLRKQFETVQAQASEFQTLAQKLAADATAPVKEQVQKTFKLPK